MLYVFIIFFKIQVEYLIIFNLIFITQVCIYSLIKNVAFSYKYFILKILPLLSFVYVLISNFITNTYLKDKLFLDQFYIKEFTDMNNFKKVISYKEQVIILCLSFIWFFVMVYLLVKRVREYFYVKRIFDKQRKSQVVKKIVNKSKSIPIRIYYSNIITEPFTFGIINPIIVIPENVERNLEMIITHEIIHCKRNDMVIKMGVELLKNVQWFNPIIYKYSSYLEKMCEFSCDEYIIKQLDFEERKKYAKLIIYYSNNRGSKRVLSYFSNFKNLKERLKYIIYPQQEKKIAKIIFLATCLISMLGGIMTTKIADNSKIKNVATMYKIKEKARDKTIKVNYKTGMEEYYYEYEEYRDNTWWRGKLKVKNSKKISKDLTEVTFSGQIYSFRE